MPPALPSLWPATQSCLGNPCHSTFCLRELHTPLPSSALKISGSLQGNLEVEKSSSCLTSDRSCVPCSWWALNDLNGKPNGVCLPLMIKTLTPSPEGLVSSRSRGLAFASDRGLLGAVKDLLQWVLEDSRTVTPSLAIDTQGPLFARTQAPDCALLRSRELETAALRRSSNPWGASNCWPAAGGVPLLFL